MILRNKKTRQVETLDDSCITAVYANETLAGWVYVQEQTERFFRVEHWRIVYSVRFRHKEDRVVMRHLSNTVEQFYNRNGELVGWCILKDVPPPGYFYSPGCDKEEWLTFYPRKHWEILNE